MKKTIFGILLLTPLFLLGCADTGNNGDEAPAENGTDTASATPATTSETYPVFVLIWSEYPSWSAIDVAGLKGIINPAEGGDYGPVEQQHKVDIVLRRRDYVQSMKEYGNGQCDAVTVTNIDALNLAKGRNSTATTPTSTSAGADGVVALGSTTIEDLKGKVVHGPEDCVTEYLCVRALEINELDDNHFTFSHMEPDAAAIALQTGGEDSKVQAAGLWQPFLLQTQRSRPESKLVFDSTVIPLEIIDMILVGNDSLEKEGGDRFAKAASQTFYELNKLLSDPGQSDAITEAIGKKFSRLPLEDMKEVLEKCKFFGTPEEAQSLFSDSKWQELMSTTVAQAAIKTGITTEGQKPTIGFNDPSAQLNFSTEYLESGSEEKSE